MRLGWNVFGVLLLIVSDAGAATPRLSEADHLETMDFECIAPLFSPDSDTFVARVVSNGVAGTLKEPPDTHLRVERVLSGSPPRGEFVARWRPFFPFWCPVGEEENIRRWEAQPLPGPAIGSRLLLTGGKNGGRYEVSASCAVAPSREVIQRVLTRKAEWRRRDELELRSKRAREKAYAELQAHVDLESLRRSADVIVRFDRSDSMWDGGDTAILVLSALTWHKGMTQENAAKVYVQISAIDHQLLSRRIGGLGEPHYVAFLRAIPTIEARSLPARRDDQQRADPRHFTLVDKRAGILVETPAISRFLEQPAN